MTNSRLQAGQCVKAFPDRYPGAVTYAGAIQTNDKRMGKCFPALQLTRANFLLFVVSLIFATYNFCTFRKRATLIAHPTPTFEIDPTCMRVI